MEVINYFESDNQEYWKEQIKKCDWGAGQFLYDLLNCGTFEKAVGESSKLLLLTMNNKLVSFCTYAKKDDIQPTDLSPWIGFVYTYPDFRGNRYFGKLLSEAEKLAIKENVFSIYVSTNHIGLYEKYGFEFMCMMNDMEGEPSRVYIKKLPIK